MSDKTVKPVRAPTTARPAHRVIWMEEQTITGEVIKPEVMIVLSRQPPKVAPRPFQQSFLWKLPASVKNNPF